MVARLLFKMASCKARGLDRRELEVNCCWVPSAADGSAGERDGL